MKRSLVPQDTGKLEGQKELCYAIDDDGHYTTVQSEGWVAKNTTLDQAWSYVNMEVEQAHQAVLSGEKSMLAYWMALNMMDINLLSNYSGFSRRKIKIHLKPLKFENLEKTVLEKYAWVFRISLEQLLLGPEK